jgi:hypothetical protein
MKYELGFYITEDGVLHSHCPENLKSYILRTLFRILYNILRKLVSTLEVKGTNALERASAVPITNLRQRTTGKLHVT